jgi:hypothetical protein
MAAKGTESTVSRNTILVSDAALCDCNAFEVLFM